MLIKKGIATIVVGSMGVVCLGHCFSELLRTTSLSLLSLYRRVCIYVRIEYNYFLVHAF